MCMRRALFKGMYWFNLLPDNEAIEYRAMVNGRSDIWKAIANFEP